MQRIGTFLAVPAIVAACTLVAGVLWSASNAAPPAAADASRARGVAVVELFTSEGCSSCPSADAALAELVAKSGGKPVYALAFHVDYWDGLGWPDRFATKAFTDRQHAYARALGLRNVYTPQAIVNGSSEFVGSDRAKLAAAVAAATDAPAVGSIAATATRIEGGVRLAVTSADLPAGAIVNAALVEDGLTSDVRRGENRGRVLPHEHVVRAFRSAAVDRQGSVAVELSIPGDVRAERATLLLFAQRPDDLHVLAAAEVVLPK